MNHPRSNVRPIDYIYTITTQEQYGWHTGVIRDGRQVLIATGIILFSPDGDLLSVDREREGDLWNPNDGPWRESQGFTRQPIRIKRFSADDIHVGIQDLTDTCGEFLENADDFSDEERGEYPGLIRDWITDGQFVLNMPGNDFYLNSQGGVESS